MGARENRGATLRCGCTECSAVQILNSPRARPSGHPPIRIEALPAKETPGRTQVLEKVGAGEGNRTLVISLEGIGALYDLNAPSDKSARSDTFERKRLIGPVRTLNVQSHVERREILKLEKRRGEAFPSRCATTSAILSITDTKNPEAQETALAR